MHHVLKSLKRKKKTIESKAEEAGSFLGQSRLTAATDFSYRTRVRASWRSRQGRKGELSNLPSADKRKQPV